MPATDYTVVLSGPTATKAPLLASLERAGADLTDGQPSRNPSHGLDPEGPDTAWLTVRHADVDQAVEAATRAGWALRAHWNTPVCGACAGVADRCLHCGGKGSTNRPAPTAEQRLAQTVTDLEARLARLEAR